MRGIITPVMQGFNALTVLIVLWYGGVRVIRGDLLVADIVAFVAYLNVLAWPTAASAGCFCRGGRAAMKRLEEILKPNRKLRAPTSLPVRGLSKESNSAMSLLCMAGDNGHPTLEGVSFSLPVGRSVGLVGRIGSGKSTVAQLVPRSSMCHPAKFLLDGKDIRKFSLRELRRTLLSLRTHFFFDDLAAQFDLWPGRSLG